ncbi:MAG TPA: tetratricopeptide repeat protein [Candidatus Latescibacteria bacterium]|nr:tetratricopeptide repeat protein [Candidatus Latescibacterota bacterium]
MLGVEGFHARLFNHSRYRPLDLASRRYVSEVIRFDEQGRHSAAIESYRQALGFDPNSAIARVNLGWRYYTGE